ncbi:hypothetical protein Poli38472_007518 [Pythium oligandrum]|uniref:Uncharacterized protein n=1 Tax=Pythium oligandrum TaxID=41045 RepID=A0A8K1FM48_PYTOL|nr:hypothetical protein Poli38472_007518 [Pythium oligandrum]|eukprot:TMW67846.1 hypothetical protein Poli38472_007518 [Pythium oligandrum]
MDSDVETLEAVVAFLDAYEAEAAAQEVLSQSGSEEATIYTTTASSCTDSGGDDERSASRVANRQQQRRVEKRVHRNRARDREKRELVRLREEVEELQRRHAHLAASRHSGTGGATSAVHHELVTAWKEVAARQEERKRNSQDENARLKERVTEQWNVLKSLKRIIERQIAESGSRSSVPTPLSIENPTSSEIYTRLLAASQEMYASTDTWVTDATSGRVSDTCVHMISPTQIVVEIVDRRLVPFGFHAVSGAYWKVMSRANCATYCFIDEDTVIDGRETLIRGQTFCDDDKIDADANIHRRAYAAVQKFIEKDRVVVTNIGQSEFIEVDSHALPGMKVGEQYWSVFEEPKALIPGACYMTSFGRVVLDFQLDGSYSLPLGSALANYFGSRVHRILNAAMGGIEDMLLQGAQSI